MSGFSVKSYRKTSKNSFKTIKISAKMPQRNIFVTIYQKSQKNHILCLEWQKCTIYVQKRNIFYHKSDVNIYTFLFKNIYLGGRNHEEKNPIFCTSDAYGSHKLRIGS